MLGSRKNKLKPAWRFKAAGVLWRVVPTPSGNLIGEARNLEEKRVEFFCLNRKTGELLWDGKSFGEQWWIGIEALAADTLFLHKYTTPELPEHQGLIAVDVHTGNELWCDTEVRFLSAQARTVNVLRRGQEGVETVALDCRSGNVVPASAARGEAPLHTSEFPQLVFDLFTSRSSMNDLMRQHCSEGTLVGPVESLATARHLIICHHERNASSTHDQQRLATILHVLDRNDGAVLFSETLQRDSTAVVPENFFVENDMLFFISERSTLTAIHLD